MPVQEDGPIPVNDDLIVLRIIADRQQGVGESGREPDLPRDLLAAALEDHVIRRLAGVQRAEIRGVFQVIDDRVCREIIAQGRQRRPRRPGRIEVQRVGLPVQLGCAVAQVNALVEVDLAREAELASVVNIHIPVDRNGVLSRVADDHLGIVRPIQAGENTAVYGRIV